MDASGEVVDVPQPAGPQPDPEPPLSLSDILSSVEVLTRKEADDKALLDSIGGMSTAELRTMLVIWATAGCPSAHLFRTITVTPPTVCSDGVARGLEDYITFCSQKTIAEHVAVLQAKVASEIQIGYANLGGAIGLVVTQAA